VNSELQGHPVLIPRCTACAAWVTVVYLAGCGLVVWIFGGQGVRSLSTGDPLPAGNSWLSIGIILSATVLATFWGIVSVWSNLRVIVTEDGVSKGSLFGCRTIHWNEVSQVSGNQYSLRLASKHAVIRLSPQLLGGQSFVRLVHSMLERAVREREAKHADRIEASHGRGL
jgi:hypothetical protein